VAGCAILDDRHLPRAEQSGRFYLDDHTRWIMVEGALAGRLFQWGSPDSAQVDSWSTMMSWENASFFMSALRDCDTPVDHLKSRRADGCLEQKLRSTPAGYAEHCWMEGILPPQPTEPRVHTSNTCAPIQLARTYTHTCHPFIALTSAAYVLTVLRHPQNPSIMP
jgi:hypothetical protein